MDKPVPQAKTAMEWLKEKDRKMKTKQVIVLRKDLNMRKGKMVAQGAHASMKVFFDRIEFCDHGEMMITDITEAMEEWSNGLFTKVCVSVNSEEELFDIYQQPGEGVVSLRLSADQRWLAFTTRSHRRLLLLDLGESR